MVGREEERKRRREEERKRGREEGRKRGREEEKERGREEGRKRGREEEMKRGREEEMSRSGGIFWHLLHHLICCILYLYVIYELASVNECVNEGRTIGLDLKFMLRASTYQHLPATTSTYQHLTSIIYLTSISMKSIIKHRIRLVV